MKKNTLKNFRNSVRFKQLSHQQMASHQGGFQDPRQIVHVFYCIETDGILYAWVEYSDGEWGMEKNAYFCIV